MWEQLQHTTVMMLQSATDSERMVFKTHCLGCSSYSEVRLAQQLSLSTLLECCAADSSPATRRLLTARGSKGVGMLLACFGLCRLQLWEACICQGAPESPAPCASATSWPGCNNEAE
jgi:hypothetical protein